MSEATLTSEDRATFAALADAIIPAYRQMPAASEVGVQDALLDLVLTSRPDIVADMMRGIRNSLGQEGRPAVQALFSSDMPAFDAVSLAASAAYYMAPTVWKRLNYPGQENAPFDAYETPEYETTGLLDRVRARGPIYRSTPR